MVHGRYIPFVRFRLPDGRTAQVGAGGLIGRASTADLRIESPEVSEAHAFISLRGRNLQILSLRRWIILDGERKSSLVLAPGQRIRLSQNVTLDVEAVELPDHVLVLYGDGQELCTLSESVYSIVTAQGEAAGYKLHPEFQPGAEAYIWGTSDGFSLRVGDRDPVDLSEGTSWELRGHKFSIRSRPLGEGALSTRSIGQNDPPMTIVARYDTVYIRMPNRPECVIAGLLARIVSELATIGRLVSWEAVAREIWGDGTDRAVMRQNWDRNLRRLRAQLREAGIRPDLVRPDGKGNVELYLLPQDQVIDES
ncbi:MAG TPA: FHA domain-containing protein [Nannocystis sp.]